MQVKVLNLGEPDLHDNNIPLKYVNRSNLSDTEHVCPILPAQIFSEKGDKTNIVIF